MSDEPDAPRRAATGEIRHCMMALFESYDHAARAAERARSAGVGEGVELYEPEDADSFASDGDGPLAGLRHLFAGDEVAIEEDYRRALESGGGVVCVRSPEEDEADETAAILREAGATGIRWFRGLKFQDMPASTA